MTKTCKECEHYIACRFIHGKSFCAGWTEKPQKAAERICKEELEAEKQ